MATTIDRQLFGKLRRVAASVPFAEDLLAAYYCARDPETPSRVRVAIFGAIAYFIMPMDAVPDFIAGLGFTDDASVLMATLATIRMHMRDDHWLRARQWLAGFDRFD
ncbi:MAG: YkvA family protein [Geminicoccaceae bacterium]